MEMERLFGLTSSDQLLFFTEIDVCLFYETSYLNKEANRTEAAPSVRVPLLVICHCYADRHYVGSD
jgi:hypothetical protein